MQLNISESTAEVGRRELCSILMVEGAGGVELTSEQEKSSTELENPEREHEEGGRNINPEPRRRLCTSALEPYVISPPSTVLAQLD